jgi:hypothetical protein
MKTSTKIMLWLDKKLESIELRIRQWDIYQAGKIIHQSPCLYCGKMVLGSINDGFDHESGYKYCEAAMTTAYPRSLSMEKYK